mmetsp:Transcript_55480/g.66737  ORF Transcript_55480/g.66737 Transcript_55480/m.66737 type:complete len:93 (-) Transcript_55480:240-518(-)
MRKHSPKSNSSPPKADKSLKGGQKTASEEKLAKLVEKSVTSTQSILEMKQANEPVNEGVFYHKEKVGNHQRVASKTSFLMQGMRCKKELKAT